MAELLFRSWANPAIATTVSSAGVQALVGSPIDRSSASALGQLGIDPSPHRARQFEARMARDADLVLTAEVRHRDLVMTEVPAAFRRTFTMKEFARLARHLRPGPPDEVIAEAAALRGVYHASPDGGPLDDDMPDPYRDAINRAREIAQQITDTVHATLEVLGLSAAAAPAVPSPVRAPVRPRPRPRPSPR